MLKSLREVLAAARPGSAIGCFNVLGFSMARAVLLAAESVSAPVIIGIASRHWEATDATALAPALRRLLERSPVPAALHLDHANDKQLHLIRQALDLGFTSVMIDGSKLPIDGNVEVTRKVVDLARSYEAGVEGEIGALRGSEGAAERLSADAKPSPFTDPAEAGLFAERTGVDALAIAVGTAHGLYTEEPRLRFDLIREIARTVPVPLVLHGATGVPDSAIRESVPLGIRKINYFSGLLVAAMDEVRASGERKDNDYQAFLERLVSRWTEDTLRQIRLFTGL